MKRESLVFGLSGAFFGVLVGWILGSQQAAGVTSPVAATVASAPAAAPASSTSTSAPALDVARAADLEKRANAAPADAAVRAELGNLYFDAERFDLAMPWYEASLKINPRDVDVSTDLAVCYYYSNQTDRALAQLDASLKLNPTHAKTLLNQGIIRAFGKQDLAGAMEAWQRVVDVAPGTEEAKRAQQGIDGLKSAHQGTDAVAGAGGSASVP
jgi:tetratricopeptide (TPR) repeat protein